MAALDVHLRAHAASDRLLEVLEEVGRVRADAGWPPLAAPIGQILASQALLHVLDARRYGTVIDEFRARVMARLVLLPRDDPQFRRNRERIIRDAERENILLEWDLGLPEDDETY